MRFSSILLVCALVLLQAVGAQAATYRFSFLSEPGVLSPYSHPDGCSFPDSSCGAIIKAHIDIHIADPAGMTEPERFFMSRFDDGLSRYHTLIRDPRIKQAVWSYHVPALGSRFSGGGDLFTARVWSVLDITISPTLEVLSLRLIHDNDRPDLIITDNRSTSRLDAAGWFERVGDNYYVADGTWTVSEVPLPAPILLMLGAFGALGFLKRRRPA